jgi:peptidoglycan/xylan/chitin deacetylase (PgdA/CDA1 family)
MFLICLTHDIEGVDHPYSSTKGIIRGLTNKDSSRTALHYLIGRSTAKKNPYDTFDRILDLEGRYGATSTFFSVPLNTLGFSTCLRKLRAAGSEIGLHGVGGRFVGASEFIRQKKVVETLLGEDVIGVRNHSLELMIPRTFEFQKLAGFKYDASYFPPRYGDKRRYAPFMAVDGIAELPLAFMDSDFQEMTSLASVEKTWNRIERVLDEYRRNEGVCTVLWHPHAFYDENNEIHRLRYRVFKEFDKLYEMILKYGSENSDKMCGCAEILKLWDRPEEIEW